MESAQKFQQFFWTLLEQLPTLITLAGCIIFVLTRWKKYPKVSPLATIGLVMMFLNIPFFTAIFIWAPDFFIYPARTLSKAEILNNVFLVLVLVAYTAEAISFVPLLVAIFIKRSHPRTS